MRELEITWNYADYLAVTERKDNEKTKKRWLDVISLINNKYYEGINTEIHETILWIDDDILEEEV